MKDLTALFCESSASGSDWNEESALYKLHEISSILPGSVSDWEVGDENWGRLLVNGQEVAFISSRIPMLFLTASIMPYVRPVIKDSGISVVETREMTDQNFCIDPSVLTDLFDVSRSENIDYDKLSLHDIWYLTV